MADLTMGLTQQLTAARAERVENALGIAALKKSINVQQQIATDLIKEMGKSAYQAAGIGQNLDARV